MRPATGGGDTRGRPGKLQQGQGGKSQALEGAEQLPWQPRRGAWEYLLAGFGPRRASARGPMQRAKLTLSSNACEQEAGLL